MADVKTSDEDPVSAVALGDMVRLALAGGGNGRATIEQIGDAIASVPSAGGLGRQCGRLTIQSGVPVPQADQTNTNLYFTPYNGDQIILWNGSAWVQVTFVETSLALGTMTSAKNYDVFGFLTGTTLTLEKLAWTNDSTRATGVSLQDGRYCKTGDKTRLYLGTFRSLNTTQIEDSAGGATTQVGGKRFLWNYFNRVLRECSVYDSTANWTYTTQTWRQANGASGNKVEFVIGLGEDVVQAQLMAVTFNNSSSSFGFNTGIGLDSITAAPRFVGVSYNAGASNVYTTQAPHFSSLLGPGYRYLSWMEKGGDGTSGGAGSNIGSQSALSAMIWC